MVDENYEIKPESNRHVLSFEVRGNTDRKRMAIIFQHVSWEETLELYMEECSNLRDQKAQSMPTSVFVIDNEIAYDLHVQLGQMLQAFQKDGNS